MQMNAGFSPKPLTQFVFIGLSTLIHLFEARSQVEMIDPIFLLNPVLFIALSVLEGF